MKVFVYEFVTGGGFLSAPREAVAVGLEREGRAMVCALAEDLAAGGARPIVLQDARLESLAIAGAEIRVVATPEAEHRAFERAVEEADATLVIAPEIEGHLTRRCQMVEQCGGVLIGPGPALRQLAGDKHAMCEHLRRAGVAVPEGWKVASRGRFPAEATGPLVVKPCAGAGAHDVYFLPEKHTGQAAGGRMSPLGVEARVERFVPGRPASVALLCGLNQRVPLPACRQQITISDDGRLGYAGGALMGEKTLRQRAERLALQAAEALEGTRGFVGIDLVLGNDPQGDEDVVIEVNARLTTSYVGLRAACRQNLAHALLHVAWGRTTTLEFDLRPLEFDTEGHVWQPTAQQV